jgi:hypothetical protein
MILLFKIFVVFLILINYYIGFHGELSLLNIACGSLLLFQALIYDLFKAK